MEEAPVVEPSFYALQNLFSNYYDWRAFRENKKVTKKLSQAIVKWMDPRVLEKLGSPVNRPGSDIWTSVLDQIFKRLWKKRDNPEEYRKDFESRGPNTQKKINMILEYYRNLTVASEMLCTINGLNETDPKIKENLIFRSIDRYLVEQILSSYEDVKVEHRSNLSKRKIVMSYITPKQLRATSLLEKLSSKTSFTELNENVKKYQQIVDMFVYFKIPDNVRTADGFREVQKRKGQFAPAVWYIWTQVEWPMMPENSDNFKLYNNEAETRRTLRLQVTNVLDILNKRYRFWSNKTERFTEDYKKTEAIHDEILESYSKMLWAQSMQEHFSTSAKFAEFNSNMVLYTKHHSRLFRYFQIEKKQPLEERFQQLKDKKGEFAPALWYILKKMELRVPDDWKEFPDCVNLATIYRVVQNILSDKQWENDYKERAKNVPHFTSQFFINYERAEEMVDLAYSIFDAENPKYLTEFGIPDDPRYASGAGVLASTVVDLQKRSMKALMEHRNKPTYSAKYYEEDVEFVKNVKGQREVKKIRQSDLKEAERKNEKNVLRMYGNPDESDSDSQGIEGKEELDDPDADLEQEAMAEGDSSEVVEVVYASDEEGQDNEEEGQDNEFDDFVVSDDVVEYMSDAEQEDGTSKRQKTDINACLSCGHLTPHSVLHGTVTAPICNDICRQRYWSKFTVVKSN